MQRARQLQTSSYPAELFPCMMGWLAAAPCPGLCAGYVSRSVAGSYDNEAVAIFALISTFYLFVRAVRLGTVSSAALAAFAYLYMAASWGAYVFISNLIPLYVLVMIGIRRYHRRLYVAYTTFWAVGGLLAMQVGRSWHGQRCVCGESGHCGHANSAAGLCCPHVLADATRILCKYRSMLAAG